MSSSSPIAWSSTKVMNVTAVSHLLVDARSSGVDARHRADAVLVEHGAVVGHDAEEPAREPGVGDASLERGVDTRERVGRVGARRDRVAVVVGGAVVLVAGGEPRSCVAVARRARWGVELGAGTQRAGADDERDDANSRTHRRRDDQVPARLHARGDVDRVEHAHVGDRVGRGSERRLAAQHRRAERVELELVGRSARELLGARRCRRPSRACGATSADVVGLITCSSPRSPRDPGVGLDARHVDHIEHVMRPVWPLGNASSARIARSTSGVRSLAVGRRDLGLLAVRAGAPCARCSVPTSIVAPPREVVLVADVGELGQREAQRGLDPPDRAELAALDDLAHALRERVVAVVERLHHDEAGARRRPRRPLRPPCAFAVNGFSHSTCLPASSAAIVHSACRPLGSGL